MHLRHCDGLPQERAAHYFLRDLVIACYSLCRLHDNDHPEPIDIMVASTWLHSCIRNKILPVPFSLKHRKTCKKENCSNRIRIVLDYAEAGSAPESCGKDAWEQKYHCDPVQLNFFDAYLCRAKTCRVEPKTETELREALCKVCANKNGVTS